MKTIKTVLLVLTMTFSSMLSANTSPTEAEPTIISEEIGTLLKSPKFQVENDILAYVKLLFNKHNQMVVLSVDSESEVVSSYIKSRLNYKKLSLNINNKNRSYIVPVRITQKN